MKTQISFPLRGVAWALLTLLPGSAKAASAALERSTNACGQQFRKSEARWEKTRTCLLGLLPSATDVTTKADISYQVAETYERQGRFGDARQRFLAVADSYPGDGWAARARFRAARLLEDELGDVKGALTELQRLARDSGDSPAAVHAVVHAELLLEPEGDEVVNEFLLTTLKAQPNTALAPVVMHRLAKRWMTKPSHLPSAARLLDDLARRRSSSYWDDALLLGAQTRMRLGDAPGAEQRLRKLLDTHESSLLPGDGNSALLDDALFTLAELQRDLLHDPTRAEATFARLVDDYPDSRLVDDALFAMTQLAQQRGDDKQAKTCLQKLEKLRPASRHLKVARP